MWACVHKNYKALYIKNGWNTGVSFSDSLTYDGVPGPFVDTAVFAKLARKLTAS